MSQAKKAISKTSGKMAARNAARTAVKTYQNYIDGKWVGSQSGEMFENINPADNRDVVGRFPLSTSDDVNAAVNAAQNAFDRWRNTPAPKRAELLFRLGEILIRNKERFTADMTREMGKVLKEAGGDVQEAIDCTYNLVKACEEAGIPPGVVNLVTGYGETVGAAMTNHPALRLISFTGSTETGRIVASACAERNAICSLEMGGKNAIIVMDDADIDLAVEGAIWGAFGTSGQRCTASSRLVVHKKAYKQFVTKLVENTKSLRVGVGADPKTDVGPVINADAVEKIMNYIRIGRDEDGAKLACGGKRLTRNDYVNGHFIEPTVFTDASPDMRISQEEIFGPVTTVIPTNS